MSKRCYKSCKVSKCKSTTIRTPEKLFICVPYSIEIRKKWLRLAGRDPATLSITTTMYMCEDHFDLPNDMENYMQYKIMGKVGVIRMKRGCVPHKFECQNDNQNTGKIKLIEKEKELENSKTTQKKPTQETITTRNATSEHTFIKFDENMQCVEETIPRHQGDIKIEPVEDLRVTLEELERVTAITQRIPTQETKTITYAIRKPILKEFRENLQCIEETITKLEEDITIEPAEDLMATLEDIETIKYETEEHSTKEQIVNTDNDKNEMNGLVTNTSKQDGDNKYVGRRTAMKIAWKKHLNTRRATFDRNDYVITYYLP